jgi:hypothetical protein
MRPLRLLVLFLKHGVSAGLETLLKFSLRYLA